MITGPVGTTFTVLGDDSILAGGTTPATGVYTVTYNSVPITDITGFRLEVIEDPSLPALGQWGLIGLGALLALGLTRTLFLGRRSGRKAALR